MAGAAPPRMAPTNKSPAVGSSKEGDGGSSPLFSSESPNRSVGSTFSQSDSLFPLPFLPLRGLPCSNSKRCWKNYTRALQPLRAANWCIDALNASYSSLPLHISHPSSSSSPSPPVIVRIASSLPSQQPGVIALRGAAISQHLVRHQLPAVHSHNGGRRPGQGSPVYILAKPSASQTRLLDRIFGACRSFLASVRQSEGVASSALYGHLLSRVTHLFTSMSTGDVPATSSSPIDAEDLGAAAADDSLRTSIPPAASTMRSLGGLDPYAMPSPSCAVPLVASRVSLPVPSDFAIKPLAGLLPKSIADQYSDPNQLLCSPEEKAARSESLRPPRVFGSTTEYLKLLRRMQSVSMVDFTQSPKAVNGVFCVPKGDDLRLIIDAQPANACFRLPPGVRLPNPSHLGQLLVPRGARCSMAKYDLKDYYHRMEMPLALRPWFALPPVRAGDLGLSGYDPDELVYPMCTTLPMGWSHSVYIAQCVHEHVLYNVTRVLSPLDNILNLVDPVVRRGCVYHAAYIDDLGLISTSWRKINALHHRIIAAYESVGLPVKLSKVVPPTSLREQSVELLGVLFRWERTAPGSDGQFVVSVAPSKVLALMKATISVLQRGRATGLEVAALVGSWAWALLLRRPAFAVFQHVFRFSLVAGQRRFDLWPSVKTELVRVLSLAPLLRASLSAPACTRFIASDASSTGGGVVATDLTPHLFDTFWPMCFNHQAVAGMLQSEHDLPLPADPASVAASLSALRGLKSQQPCLADGPVWQPLSSPYKSLEGLRWATIISTQWRFQEHINLLELRAFHLALLWIVSLPRSCSTRLFALLDSAVAFYAIRKGRSSSPNLLPLIRKINVLLLAADIAILPIWVPSAVNPADAPSRA